MSTEIETHKHTWVMGMHADYCHKYETTYVCACGATAQTMHERSPSGFGAIWMAEGCERCVQLSKGEGSKPTYVLRIWDKDGKLEKDEQGEIREEEIEEDDEEV